MWEPFIQSIQQAVPEADIVHDKFHVSKYLGEAVDKVRRQEHKELMAQGDETLKGTRQLWLYNPQNFSPEQAGGVRRAQGLAVESGAGLGGQGTVQPSSGTYQEEGWARRFFKSWFGWVSRSRLKPMSRSGRAAQAASGQSADVSETSYHQRGHRRAELENPEHQIRRPGLPQFQKLPNSHPVLLRKAQSLPTMIREESPNRWVGSNSSTEATGPSAFFQTTQ